MAAILLILAFVYYTGHSARSADAYTAMATPFNKALSAEMAGYTRNQRTDLAAPKSDLIREVKRRPRSTIS